jgi:hypothetical protein
MMNVKGFERKQSGDCPAYYPYMFLEGLMKTMKSFRLTSAPDKIPTKHIRNTGPVAVPEVIPLPGVELNISCSPRSEPSRSTDWVEVEVKLRSTVSRPVYLGDRLPSGVHGQIFVFCLKIEGFLMLGALSDERMGL